MTSTVLKYLSDNLPSCVVTKPIAQEYFLQLLTKQSCKVEIWESIGSKWSLSKKASPGNIQSMEEMLYSAARVIYSVVLAVRVTIKDGERIIAAAFTDATSQKIISLTEFTDNAKLTNFESLLIQTSVKECLVCDDISAVDRKTMRDILTRIDIVETVTPKC